jgi:hypothetical protein
MKHVLTLILTLSTLFAVAQTNTDFFSERVYFYDEFQLGTAYFSEGNPVRVRLNYNFVTQEMQFLNHQDNDAILILISDPKMTHIKIGNDIFVPVEKQGFAQVIVDGPIALLRKKRVFVEGLTRGYGATNTTVAMTSLNSISYKDGTYEFPAVTKTRTVLSFYLMKNNRIYAATRKNFLRLYSEIKPQLKKFLSENKIDFKNEAHLRGLTKFCNNLLNERKHQFFLTQDGSPFAFIYSSNKRATYFPNTSNSIFTTVPF